MAQIISGDKADKAFKYNLDVSMGRNNRCSTCNTVIAVAFIVETENENGDPLEHFCCSKECAEYYEEEFA